MASKALVQIDLREKQIFQLLKLQQLFHSHYLTEELLNGMISLYVKFVENIHYNQHPLRIYFMEKIKFVLSRPEIIRILEKKSVEQNKNMRQTIRGMVGVTQQDDIEIRKMKQQAKQEIRQNHFINHKKERNYDKTEKGYQMRQKERNMKIQMQVQIMEEVQQNMLKMKKELNERQANQNKAAEINKIVQKQDMALNERLAKRRKKLRKKSVNQIDKEFIQIQKPAPIAKHQLLEMKKEITQTYQRFTRLTQNKSKRGTQRDKENIGRVKVKVQSSPIYQEDIFNQLQKEQITKMEQPKSFLKKKKASNHESPLACSKKQQQIKDSKTQQVKVQAKAEPVRDSGSTIEYKAFDQNKGRVTVRQKNYEQIEQEQLF